MQLLRIYDVLNLGSFLTLSANHTRTYTLISVRREDSSNIHMLFWFTLGLRDGGTSQSLLQTAAISRMCLLSRWQNNVRSVPETPVNSTAGMLWLWRALPGFPLTSRLVSLTLQRSREAVTPHVGHMLGVSVLSSSLFGCLLVGAEAAAICPQGHIKHSKAKKKKEGKPKHSLMKSNKETAFWGHLNPLIWQYSCWNIMFQWGKRRINNGKSCVIWCEEWSEGQIIKKYVVVLLVSCCNC